MTRSASLLLLFAAMAVAPACGDEDSDLLGVAITEPGAVSPALEPQLAWSADGREVFFLSAAGRLEAASVDGGAARVIDERTGRRSRLVRSADGGRLYFLLDPDGDGVSSLEWVSTSAAGAGERIAVDASTFALSPGGAAIAWSTEDGAALTVRDFGAGSSFYVGRGYPLLFAPGGTRLLCSGQLPGESIAEPLFSMDLAGGDPATLELDREDGERLRVARWDTFGVHLLMSGIDGGELFVFDAETGMRRTIYQHTSLEDVLEDSFLDFGPDAGTAYAWTSRCLEAGAGFMSCARTRFDLHRIHTGSADEEVVASGTGAAARGAELGPGGFAVSPDGARIAFVLRSRIWLMAL